MNSLFDAYDMVEIQAGRGCVGCSNQVAGRNLGYCARHSTSGTAYLFPKEDRLKVNYSPINEALARGEELAKIPPSYLK